ncbi:MAG: hypothetical protein QGI68_17440 [Pseudomonadales bacterium]|jgi:hypothetical protein|nr:hypothetical protein [Pseudomonadales bacterium]MDP7597329.1 hypothetical protein [Pseudomonadales bacterium]|tara:strand:- start:345 stop:1901 length:1557 start_codon:yes stop_codon:yes gene_type:complete
MRYASIAILFILAGCQMAQVPTPMDGQAFFAAGPYSASQRFESAKRSTPELIAFLRRMPKGADLHNHLGGATYADFLIDSARHNGKRFSLEQNHFTDANGEGTVSFAEFITNQELIARFRNALSVRGWLAEGGSGHDHFFQSFRHIGTAGRTTPEMLAEILARNHYQNIQYLELMANAAPSHVIGRFAAAYAGLHLDDLERSYAPFTALTDDPDVLQSFRDVIDEWEVGAAAILEQQHGLTFEQAPTVRYIPQLNRAGTLDRFFIGAVLFMTATRADERIIALNMVAPEDLPLARRQFDAQMRILDFLWQKLGRPNMTLHAGELSLRESPVEPMLNRIRRSIDEGHASRIGHGVSIAWELDLVGLLEQMSDTGVMVEIIPSSSEVILGIAGDDHPLRLYEAAAVPLCIATDDEAVNRSNLTMEYVKIVQRYDLTYADLKRLVRNCLEYSFLDGEGLYVDGDYSKPIALAEDVTEADWQPSDKLAARQSADPKLAQQISLERAWVEFETSLSNGFREAR